MKSRRFGFSSIVEILMVVVVCLAIAALVAEAADREQYHVTTLRVGTSAQQVSGDSDQLLEKLLSGAMPAGSDFSIPGTLTVGSNTVYTPGSQAVITGGATAVINPTSQYMKITPTTASDTVVTATVAACTTLGQVLIIEVAGTNSLVLEDNSTTMAIGANWTGAVTDTIGLINNSSNQWRRLFGPCDN